MAKNFNAWPEGWPKSLNYPAIPVHAFLAQTAERVPNRIAIVFGGMELTYGELRELSERFASALAGMGVKKGDRVAIHLPNCPQFAVAYYGALKIGAVFTPLSPLLAARGLSDPGQHLGQLAFQWRRKIHRGLGSNRGADLRTGAGWGLDRRRLNLRGLNWRCRLAWMRGRWRG